MKLSKFLACAAFSAAALLVLSRAPAFAASNIVPNAPHWQRSGMAMSHKDKVAIAKNNVALAIDTYVALLEDNIHLSVAERENIKAQRAEKLRMCGVVPDEMAGQAVEAKKALQDIAKKVEKGIRHLNVTAIYKSGFAKEPAYVSLTDPSGNKVDDLVIGKTEDTSLKTLPIRKPTKEEMEDMANHIKAAMETYER